MIGNDEARAAFAAAADSGSLHHAWLIAGPEGVGKATFARQAALGLLGDTEQTRSLIAAGSHPDYRELRRLPKDAEKSDQDLARSIPIAQVRSLLPMFSTHSARRVVVIDAIDDLERPGASNALLKNLEEPPQGTIFLAISHAPGRLLPTIRSRCRLLRFGRLSDAEVGAVLRAQLPDIKESELLALIGAADGSPGRAVSLAGLDIGALDKALEAIAGDGDPSNAKRSSLAKTLAGKTAQARYEAFLDRAPSFIAQRAAQMKGTPLRHALDAHDAARNLAGSARGLSLDVQGTVFEMAGLVASLARR